MAQDDHGSVAALLGAIHAQRAAGSSSEATLKSLRSLVAPSLLGWQLNAMEALENGAPSTITQVICEHPEASIVAHTGFVVSLIERAHEPFNSKLTVDARSSKRSARFLARLTLFTTLGSWQEWSQRLLQFWIIE